MKIHPLKACYIQYIREHYGKKVWSDDYERTARIAQKVHQLGVSYEIFIECAAMLWNDWSVKQGHPYPYWNVITSDGTFERLQELHTYSEYFSDDDYADDYESELKFAYSYVDWMLGNNGSKPHRANGKPPAVVLMAAAECVCNWYGIPYLSSNYNVMAKQVLHG